MPEENLFFMGKSLPNWCAFSVQIVHKHKSLIALGNKIGSIGVHSMSRNEVENFKLYCHMF